MSIKDDAEERVGRVRRRWPLLDHLVRMVQHYLGVNGNLQAGAVTYFAFLSFFPVLALAFAVVGWVARFYPGSEDVLIKAIDEVLPGMVGDEEGQISLGTIESAAPGIFSVGILAILYSGLGWLSSMRKALLVVFELPDDAAPNFVIGKLRDLLTLTLIGLTLLISVALAGFVRGFSEQILELLGLASTLSPLVAAISIVVGLAANMLLFYALFRLLARPPTPPRSLWAGALLGALGFELLKLLSTYLMASTKSQPAFQAFGIALILVVWMNYFSRVVFFAASWAHTSPRTREIREAEERHRAMMTELTRVDLHEAEEPRAGRGRRTGLRAFGAGAAAAGVAALALRRRGEE